MLKVYLCSYNYQKYILFYFVENSSPLTSKKVGLPRLEKIKSEGLGPRFLVYARRGESVHEGMGSELMWLHVYKSLEKIATTTKASKPIDLRGDNYMLFARRP